MQKPPAVRAQPAPAAARQSDSDDESDEDDTSAAPDVAPYVHCPMAPITPQARCVLCVHPTDTLAYQPVSFRLLTALRPCIPCRWLRPATNPSAQQPSVSLLPDPLDALKEVRSSRWCAPDRRATTSVWAERPRELCVGLPGQDARLSQPGRHQAHRGAASRRRHPAKVARYSQPPHSSCDVGLWALCHTLRQRCAVPTADPTQPCLCALTYPSSRGLAEAPMDTQTARVELESNKRKAMDAGGLLSRKAVLHRDKPQCGLPPPVLSDGVEGFLVCTTVSESGFNLTRCEESRSHGFRNGRHNFSVAP